MSVPLDKVSILVAYNSFQVCDSLFHSSKVARRASCPQTSCRHALERIFKFLTGFRWIVLYEILTFQYKFSVFLQLDSMMTPVTWLSDL